MNEKSLIEALLPAVEQQLDSKETPYVKTTFTRLVEAQGLSPDEAMEAIALCLAEETNRVFIEKRNFDELAYQELLNGLPEIVEVKVEEKEP